MLYFSAFLVALVVTMALIPPLVRAAEKYSFVDIPNERKVHTGAITRVGGVAMVVGACLPIMLWLPHSNTIMAFTAALFLLLVFGIWDDCREIDYRIKLVGQVIAVFTVIIWGGVEISLVPFAGFEPVASFVSIPITVLFLVGVTNAVNLADGLDGLAGGIALLSLAAIALFANLADGDAVVLTSLVVAGTILGFLRYNTFPATVFMGDTGSQFLGFTVGVLAIMLTQQVNTALNPLLPLFLVGLPIIDTFYVMIKRISQGCSPFVADKGHMHHRLLDLGMAHYEAVSVIYISQLLFLLAAFMLRFQNDLTVLTVYLLLATVILGGLNLLRKKRALDLGLQKVTQRVLRFDANERIKRHSLTLIKCGLTVYLLAGAATVSDVPVDIALGSLLLLVLLLIRLTWSSRLRYFSLRLLVFPGIAFVVYLMHLSPLMQTGIARTMSGAQLVLLLVLMLIVIRLTKDHVFRTTPTDLLVVTLAGGVGVLHQQALIAASIVPVVLGIVVLFYAAELVMRHMQQAWNCFTFGLVVALAVLSFGIL